MTDSDKDTILQNIYYDVEDGYDTLNGTYKKAHAAMPSITFQYVKQWMSKQKLRQGKQLRVWNSYVSPGPKHQYAVDIADMQKIADKNDRYKYLLLCIDTFTKYGHGVPMRSKDANEVTMAMKEIFKKMGTCKELFSDDEGAMSSKPFKQLLKENSIKHLITLSHASHAEKFIQRVKNMIMTRINGMDEQVSWIKLLPFVLTKYNEKTIHDTIGMTPAQATLKRNEIEVLFNIASKSKHARRYPPLHIGSFVRKFKKGDNVGSKKGWVSKWSDQVFEIEKIENGLYFLKDDPVKRGVLRHDLLRIDESQKISEDAKTTNLEKISKYEFKPTKRLTSKSRTYQIV